MIQTDARQPVRVVVVEDDDDLRDGIIVPILREHGFDVVGLASASALYSQLHSIDPRVIVLDVGLPDESGFAVARRLRQESSVGIVMLTGLREEPDHVRGLANGADAYLTKPVSAHLLVATVRSLVRRLDHTVVLARSLQWRLDGDGWRLVAPNGKTMDLAAAERLVLRRLLASIGTPVPRDAFIADLVEGDREEFDPHRLEMLVHRLRRRVAAMLGTDLPLRAVRGVGYVFTDLGD